VLYEEEKHYLNVSLQNILQEDQTFDQTQIDPAFGQTQIEEESSNNQPMDGFEKSRYFKLFRVAPSK
jgi:hypothetical protein